MFFNGLPPGFRRTEGGGSGMVSTGSRLTQYGPPESGVSLTNLADISNLAEPMQSL